MDQTFGLGLPPSTRSSPSYPPCPVPCVRDGIQAKSGSSFGGREGAEPSFPRQRWCHDEERPSIRRYVRRCQRAGASPPRLPLSPARRAASSASASAVPANPRQYTASMHHCIPPEPRHTHCTKSGIELQENGYSCRDQQQLQIL